MKKLVILLSILFLSLVILPVILADEETQVELAYECLQNRINQSGCSSLTFEQKVFSLLAVQKCGEEVIAENYSNQCWPSSGCRLKPTAQAILALNEVVNTTTAENWLLTQTDIPTGIDWFLEIESLNPTICTIYYSESFHTISIAADKKISSNAGSCLTLSTGAYDDYFLLVSPSCYNQEFDISCDQSFITTLLFKKQGSDLNPLHVLEEVHSASADGTTTEIVDALCFSQSNTCNYEGSLWATLVLYYLDYDVSPYMPYLLTMKDDNQFYLPESFLYFLTGKLRTDLLSKQILNKYWDVSGEKYYDTALALWPFHYESPLEKQNSKNWLLDVQETDGCWNNGDIRDTAFLLYSIWSGLFVPPECEIDEDCGTDEECIDGKCIFQPECETDDNCSSDKECIDGECVPRPECEEDNDCSEIDCKTVTCDVSLGICDYVHFDCQDDDDCCPPGCDSSTDNDCPEPPECTIDTEDIDCPSDDNSSKYCLNDDVYKNMSIWNCINEICIENETIKLVDNCTSSEECYYGNCLKKSEPEDECDNNLDCPGTEVCVKGTCVEKLDCEDEGYFCMSKADCKGEILYDYDCDTPFRCCDTEKSLGTCSSQWGDTCNSDEYCSGVTAAASDLGYGETCCITGSCKKTSNGNGGTTTDDSCGSNNGICRTSCYDSEDETSYYTCDYGEVCCLETQNGRNGGYAWIWILLILILLAALGIVFRDKLRTQWMKLKSKFGGKKSKEKRRLGMPPLMPLSKPIKRILPRRIFPPAKRPSPMKKPEKKPIEKEKPKSELDDVLKKLKNMGK